MNWAMSLLLAAFLFAFFSKRSVSAEDWLGDLLSDVLKINERVQGNVRNINKRVQSDVRKINEQVHRNVQENLSRINQHVDEQVSSANQQIAEALKQGESGPYSSVITRANTGSSRRFRSGVDANGKPYQIESENLVVGKTLFHMERIYNFTSNILEEQRYTLDLSDPNAKPVYSNVTRMPFNI